MLKRLQTVFMFLFMVQLSFAQSSKGTIVGKIVAADSLPAAYVPIGIKGTSIGTTSDAEGNYKFKAPEGNQTLLIKFVGHEPEEKEIVVKAGETTTADFTLRENAKELQEVVITGNQATSRESEFVARLPLKNLENPQVYNVVSSELLKEQGIVNYDDAFRNVPGVSRAWESTGRSGDGASYLAIRGLATQATILNGLPGLTTGNLDPANVEKIEVLKGPSGTLFGSSVIAYGGLINTVTKKPYQTFGGEVAYNTGSFGLNRVSADINMPLSTVKKVALRLNTAYHTENSFQDAGFKNSFFIAPTLSYEVNNRLSFLMLSEFMQEERAAPPVFFQSNRSSPLEFRTVQELNLDPKLSFTSNDLTIKNPRYSLQGQMKYKLSDQWTSQTVVSNGMSRFDGYYSYIWENATGNHDFGQYFSKQSGFLNTNDIQQNFIGDFKIGGLRNRVVIGADYFSRNQIDNSSGYGLARNVTPQGEVNYIDPYTGVPFAPTSLTKQSIDGLLSGTGASSSNSKDYAYSAYVSDVINITPSLMAMASLRVDRFDNKNYQQTALSPKFGLVFQPLKEKLSFFANYMNGFVNIAPRQVTLDPSTPELSTMKSFKPEQANQLEVGVKTSLYADRIYATVSVYDIKVKNRVTNVIGAAGFVDYRQGGELESKGFEADINVRPLDGLNIIAGYAYNQCLITKGNENDFYAEAGTVPGGQGPQHLANAWATYKFLNGSLKNFGLGIGGNYAGENKSINSQITGNFTLPSYTLVNASLFYNSDLIRISLNLNNIGNVHYYTSYWSINPQKPRNLVASFAYKF